MQRNKPWNILTLNSYVFRCTVQCSEFFTWNWNLPYDFLSEMEPKVKIFVHITVLIKCNLYNLFCVFLRPYSKINKSTRAKMAVIFVYFRFSVIAFCVDVTIKMCELIFKETSLFDCCNNTERNYTKPEVSKNSCHFYPCWFVDFCIRSIHASNI
jgi:hypothetical protein